MLSAQRDDDDSQYLLVAKLDNARNVSNILKAIHFKDIATVIASPLGLKVTVEDAKCVQANAFIQESIFHHYHIKEDQLAFKINLTVLLECLTIFGSSATTPSGNTTLKMCYAGYGCPLILMLEEDGVLTDCSLKTLEPDEVLDFDFSSANVVNKIIMKSECLKEVFSELDTTSEVLQILISPDQPYLQFSTFGNAGSTHSSFPKDSEMVESFLSNQTQTNRYKISLLKPSVKALNLSTRISIRTDSRGFLSLQYMIKTEDGQICFVEYYCAPDEEITDDPET
ncbi:cell cycle checkpoint protein RAD1 [Biomphalaria glabrata]|uniref:Cell cycle checkpoint protein RAD1 n=1 Tax=Biomphalaria glabrata TaxID=6526 RepID=A0A2C9JGT5_BIOGL|nr:cell cycle checkpoint protein RAD1-like [Biomphalaria glabrata]XP_013068242.1 cell cycle checkpoint protein RAD1-like [Biomphalaria glabrata]XP_055862010.1 cell cycle checkpoint protein RAD1-like [Biomphalaria glabrata]XP_055862011.1 cell cycle checkpoint protein RAD1-like [Biomphalaria glabrata]XP_055862012.1 cell cycle checkpoint protein RAD1-like [Biomphalaria glabrata]XP_055862014.1 cell cycle checkpoint protein RAD1-like [Biomphalaria glabrata]KAI8753441.1 cell cycle checkpoint protei